MTITQLAAKLAVSRDIAQFYVDKGHIESIELPGRASRMIRRIPFKSYEAFCRKYAKSEDRPRRRRSARK